MLVHFSFDGACFSSKLLCDKYNPSIHEQLNQYWKKYGVFVFPENLDFKEYLKTIDQNHRKIWTAVLTSPNFFKVKKLTENWKNLNELANHEPMYNGIEEYSKFFKVLFSDEDHFYMLTELGTISKLQGSFEIITPGQILVSPSFNEVKNNFEKKTVVGDELETIWKNKFSDLCKYCTDITIIDRYLFKSIVEDKIKNSSSSFEYLLKKISKYDGKYRIIIVSSINEINEDNILLDKVKALGAKDGEEALLNYINKFLTSPLKKNISSFKIIDVENKFFRVSGHDRYFRFDNSYYRISKGLNFMRVGEQIEDNNFDYFTGEKVVKDLILSIGDYHNSEKIIV
ncbi:MULTISPECIES: hypothetical protein [Acinetobacter]|uniref:hypothetical protein n=1 Tax=Acinetobacter TaxID=469 RepID=UPI00103BE452|nr:MULTISPECIES: hypothetical protein [unclassified Acinetobacter]TCB17356.1 hypothetical protein E0H79_08930 [Acinetobacter sp. ANC 5045]